MVEVIYGEPEATIRGHRSAMHPSLVRKGEFTRLQGFRWDDGSLLVPSGPTLYLAAPESSMTMVDMWSVGLNGAQYLVGAFKKSSVTRIYYSTGGAAWTEATEVGGWHGDSTGTTRFATDSGRLSVCVIRAPQGYFGGATLPSRDVLLICNGEDYNRIWDPGRSSGTTLAISAATNASPIEITTTTNHNRNTGDTVVISGVLGNTAANGSWTITKVSATKFTLDGSTGNAAYTSGGTISDDSRMAIHQPVTIPSDASLFSQRNGFHRFWQVRGNSGKTYYSSGVVNDTAGTNQFDFANSNYDTYTGTNACITWTWGTATAASQIATVYMSASLNLGKGLVMFTEDVTAAFGADIMLGHVKIEVNAENVAYNAIATAWSTLFDPTSTDEKERRYVHSYLAGPDTDPARSMWFFPCDHIAAASRVVYHIRVTRLTNAPSPSVTAQVIILAMCGGGAVPGGSEATISYEDEPGRSESRRFVASDIVGESLRSIGGPYVFSSSQADFRIPVVGGVFYDLDLLIRNSDGAATITGGLNGEPSRFNVYLRCPTSEGLEPEALYWYSVGMYTAGYSGGSRAWAQVYSTRTIHHLTSSITDTYSIDWTSRDSGRKAPSDYQIAIPPAYACLSRNGRVFVGNIKDLASQHQYGDAYFSGWNQPFRFQSIVTSAVSGGRLSTDGERIQGFISSAAGTQNVSHIHVITDKWLYPMGFSGPQGSNPLDATVLSVLQPAVSRGTNSPRTITERDGAIFYLDSQGQWVKIAGEAVSISRLAVDDKPRSIPAGRMDDVCAVFFRDRLRYAYTESGGTTNTRLGGWHDVLSAWEFDDTATYNAERMCTHYESSAAGTGQKWLIATQAGVVYEEESNASATIPIRLTTGDIILGDSEHPGIIDTVIIDAEAQANTLTVDRILRSPSGTYRTTIDLTSGWVTDENQAHTEVVATSDSEGEQSRTAQLDIYGNMTAGTRLYRIAIKKSLGSNQKAKAN